MIIGNCPVCGAEMRVGTDMTNGDRIRVLTDEELANRIVCHVSCSCCPLEQEDCKKHCYELWLEWLRKEAE